MQLVSGKDPKAAHDSLRQLKANCPAERSQSKEDAPQTIIQGTEWPSKTESRKRKKKNPKMRQMMEQM